MKKYIKPDMTVENLLVDETIAALESISGAELGGGNTDTGTFDDLFGNN